MPVDKERNSLATPSSGSGEGQWEGLLSPWRQRMFVCLPLRLGLIRQAPALRT